MPGVLGIDTSCYTTSAAFASESMLLSRRKLLPVEQGERGLRQSEAVFAHVRQLPELISQVTDEVKKAGESIGGVCVSASPVDGEDSYMPVFEAGKAFASALSSALDVPLFTTTHQRGHLRAARQDSGLTGDAFLCLHLSGGTTDVLYKRGEELQCLSRSMDLHAGQLVDRVGVALGMKFPAGPYLEQAAMKAAEWESLPVSMDEGGCHLSGAENALMRMITKGAAPEYVARSTFDLLCRTVLRLLKDASDRTGEKRVLIFGGVASSALLRELLAARNEKRRLGLELYFGKPEYSGDNAAGVALTGFEKMIAGGK
ncbi:MAG: O-sialoglycoprotein endopeptidase [Clostridiales bacterium]|nr:O-sialoglycoprotein endopeptidase [Clostridiales bacterium]